MTSTLVGARTLEQLNANLAALTIEFTPDQLARLDTVSAPTLDFPAPYAGLRGALQFAGLTVDGITYGQGPVQGDTRY